MKHRKLLGILAVCNISLFIVTNVGFISAHARHIQRHPQYYTMKMYHQDLRKYQVRQRRERYRKRKMLKLKHLDNQGTRLLNQIRSNLFKDINRSRIRYHRRQLHSSIWLQRAANYRISHVQAAYEYTHNTHVHMNSHTDAMWVHGYDNHTSLGDYAYHHKHYFKYCGENVGDYIVGGIQYQTDYTLAPYNNSTPSGVAANINNDLMYHDTAEGNNNGHRDNELNKHYHYLGVSVRYNPKENYGTFTEDFAS